MRRTSGSFSSPKNQSATASSTIGFYLPAARGRRGVRAAGADLRRHRRVQDQPAHGLRQDLPVRRRRRLHLRNRCAASKTHAQGRGARLVYYRAFSSQKLEKNWRTYDKRLTPVELPQRRVRAMEGSSAEANSGCWFTPIDTEEYLGRCIPYPHIPSLLVSFAVICRALSDDRLLLGT